MDHKNTPLVSIGVPVFNESRFLDQSLNALTLQDYSNLEIIISDNGSNDDTKSICQKYTTKFPHVTYNRFDTNLGIAINSSYVLEQSSGKYFLWASGHDLWDKNYISECVQQLENSQDGLIAFGSSKWIDAHNNQLNRQFGWLDTRGQDVISRYIMTFWGNMHPILGVINREALTSHPILNTPGADLIILARLSLQGTFIHSTNTSWSRREFRNESTYADKIKRYQSNEFGMSKTIIDKYFPLARLPIELYKCIFSCKQPLSIKLILSLMLIIMLPVKYIAGKYVTT